MSQSYEEVVQGMIKQYNLMKKMNKVNPDETFENMVTKDLDISRAQRKLEDTITNLSKDPEEFMKFAFELRK